MCVVARFPEIAMDHQQEANLLDFFGGKRARRASIISNHGRSSLVPIVHAKGAARRMSQRLSVAKRQSRDSSNL